MKPMLRGVLVAVLVVLGAELVLRAFDAGDRGAARLLATDTDAESVDWLVPHPQRLYALRPDMRHADAHAGYYALGAWPFRGRPAEPLPDALPRVLVLGDSCVFGVGLHSADTLPERIARELADAGLAQDRVAVLNLGVPGYSTPQMARLLSEALPRWNPAAVVLYPAAWNDQAPALGADDLQRLRAANASGFVGALRGSALVGLLRGVLRDAPDPAALRAAWERGDPGVRPRVAPADTRLAVRAMIDACRAAGAAPTVVVPAHPASTREKHPRAAADAQLVADVAREAGLEPVDARAVFGSVDVSDAELFSDHVHPSALGMRLLAPVVAQRLLGEPRLAAAASAPRAGGPLAITDVTPTTLPELGDARVSLTLEGWSRDDPLPAITLAGAPLLDLRAESGHTLSGLAMANAPGAADLVVQTATTCTVAPRAVDIMPARIELLAGDPPRLRFSSRPGDRAELFVSERWQRPPKLAGPNAVFLHEPTTHSASWTLEAGADGTAERDAPEAAALLAAGWCAQAVVLPAGLEADARTRTRVKRWLAPLAASR